MLQWLSRQRLLTLVLLHVLVVVAAAVAALYLHDDLSGAIAALGGGGLGVLAIIYARGFW